MGKNMIVVNTSELQAGDIVIHNGAKILLSGEPGTFQGNRLARWTVERDERV